MQGDLCQRLAWDSEFFGLRIARLLPGQLMPETLAAAETWCAAEQIDCLYLLADSGHPPTAALAEDHGFRLMDLRLAFAASLGDMPAPSPAAQNNVRLCRPEDVPRLRSLARVSHRESRFYADPGFPERLCDALYETWIEKSCGGYAQAVYVADTGSGPVGYLTVHCDGGGDAHMGLLAVTPEAQGQGLGQALTRAVIAWCRREGLRNLHVVTQGRNIRAQRLYARTGFLPQSLQLWYHRWFSPGRGANV